MIYAGVELGGTKCVAVLGSSDIQSHSGWVQAAQDFAKPLGIEILSPELRDPQDFAPALAQIGQLPGSGLLVVPGSLVARQRAVIIGAARQFRMPAVYPLTFYSKAGGLLSYGIDVADIYRRAAAYVDRILKGTKPADIPIEQPTKFELAVNARTAQALKFPIPPSVLVRADDVIE